MKILIWNEIPSIVYRRATRKTWANQKLFQVNNICELLQSSGNFIWGSLHVKEKQNA